MRAAEKHGRNELDKIAGDIEGKAREEVIAYSKVCTALCGCVWFIKPCQGVWGDRSLTLHAEQQRLRAVLTLTLGWRI